MAAQVRAANPERMGVGAKARLVYCPTRGEKPAFQSEEARCGVLRSLAGAARRHRCQVHGYVVMPTYFEALVTPSEDHPLEQMMRGFRAGVTLRLRARGLADGKVWEGHFGQWPVSNALGYLAHLEAIHFRALRAGLVSELGEYEFSSYRDYWAGRSDGPVPISKLRW